MNKKLELLPVVEAVKAATGRDVHYMTGRRWTGPGLRGVKLKSVLFGGERMSTVEWALDFVEALTAKDAQCDTQPEIKEPTPKQRAKDLAKSKRELEELLK